MNDRDVDALVATANPLPRTQANGLPIDAAEQELVQAIMAGSAAAPAAGPRARLSTVRAARRVVLVIAAAGATAAVLATLPAGDGSPAGPGGGPQRAFAAELVRFAEASPLVLLDAPGWRVDYADEQSAVEGEMRFVEGAAPEQAGGDGRNQRPTVDERQRAAELHWRSGTLGSWVRDRAASASVSTTAPVLGTEARVFEYHGGSPGDRDITALWRDGDRVLELRSAVPDMETFKARLAALRRVDTNAWLRALPASVVKEADRGNAVQAMLKGIPLPPGFEPASIPGAELTKDRYQLGAAVSGAVACTWIKRWSDARRRSDTQAARAAIAAMATAKDWPILQEMSKMGAFPEVVKGYAAAMPSGRWAGRPLEGDVESGLGCSERGARLRGR